jgi:protein SCO1/2
MAWRTATAFIVALVAGSWSLSAATDGLRAFTSEGARRLAVERTPRILPEVPLQDQDGTVFSFAAYRGRLLLVDFIYTRCPTVCRTLGDSLRHIQERLPEDIRGREVVLLSISFDPLHDNPEELRHYGEHYGADGISWRLARPLLPADTERLLNAFGVVAIPDGAGGFEHNAALHLVNRSGRLEGILDYAPIEPVVDRLWQSL